MRFALQKDAEKELLDAAFLPGERLPTQKTRLGKWTALELEQWQVASTFYAQDHMSLNRNTFESLDPFEAPS